jgi:hypothetical protein
MHVEIEPWLRGLVHPTNTQDGDAHGSADPSLTPGGSGCLMQLGNLIRGLETPNDEAMKNAMHQFLFIGGTLARLPSLSLEAKPRTPVLAQRLAKGSPLRKDKRTSRVVLWEIAQPRWGVGRWVAGSLGCWDGFGVARMVLGCWDAGSLDAEWGRNFLVGRISL